MLDLTYGVVVLSAKKATPIPMLPSINLEDHISGSVFQGSAGGVAPFKDNFYLPARGRSYRIFSNRGVGNATVLLMALSDKPLSENQDFRSHFASVCDIMSYPGRHLIVTQAQPFGFVGLHSNEGGLRLFGVYSKSCELLVWCNTPDLDRFFAADGRKEWRVYRFKERPSFNTVVFTRRVCQRWYRWSSTLTTSDLKFQALEASLFSHEDERFYPTATPERPGSEED